MKILLIHTFYKQAGGEDAVFESEKLLLAGDNDIQFLKFKNQTGIKGAFQFLVYPFNFIASRKLRNKIKSFKPDLIHMHNLHFASGPLLVRTANKSKIPIVLTVHNYRLLCPSGTLLYKNEVYLNSINANFPWDAIRKGVYRDSKLQTFWLAFTIWIHKKLGTWRMIDTFLVLTEFSKKLFVKSAFGIAENKFLIKPNFAKDEAPVPIHRNEEFLFVGRLAIEKGIIPLLEAFKGSNARIKIAGDGPLKNLVIDGSRKYSNIEYLGNLNKKSVLAEMATCTALIFPSIWFEGMPMTLIEAFLTKTAIIANDLGAMSSMITNKSNGLHFFNSSSESLREVVEEWAFKKTPEEKDQIRQNARKSFEENYTVDLNTKILREIYNNILNT